MVKSFPCHDLLAEPLQRYQFVNAHLWTDRKTHTCNLIEVIRRVNPQNLDCNMAALVFTLPDVGIPTTIQRVNRSVVTERDLE